MTPITAAVYDAVYDAAVMFVSFAIFRFLLDAPMWAAIGLAIVMTWIIAIRVRLDELRNGGSGDR